MALAVPVPACAPRPDLMNSSVMPMLLLVISLFLSGCLARPVVRMQEPETHARQTRLIEQQVLAVAQTGDWLVTRGYHATDGLVANATGIPISHAAVYDAAARQVVEAEGKGVHLTALSDFVAKSYRVMVIRPRWRTEANAGQAWANAAKLVGKSYDFLGTIGFNYPSRFYCSELAVSVYREWYSGKEKFPKVIKPGELYLYGSVVYDSLPRDEM